jgi:hypothetical protein
MAKIPALALLLMSSAAWGGDYKVSFDKKTHGTIGGAVAVPEGAVITVETERKTQFAVALVGPTGIVSESRRKSWSTTLHEPGGYTLQYGREQRGLLERKDFVVTADPDKRPMYGEEDARRLYELPAE